MRSKSVLAVLLVAFVAIVTGVSVANEITISASTSGDLVFTDVNPGVETDLAFTGGGVSGVALYQSDILSYHWSLSGPLKIGAPTLGDYPITTPNGSTLTMTFCFPANNCAANELMGVATLTDLVGANTVAPELIGTLSIQTSTGIFAPQFAVNTTADLDFSLNLTGSHTRTIQTVFFGVTGTTTQGPISSGEILPTPEPGSLALLGTGLLGIAGVLKRRLF
jgi:hypothetical protein